jgi:hypothetical protein
MNTIPIYDGTAPITCTIDSDEIPERIELVERMRQNLERLERTPHGLLLHFPDRPDIQGDLSRFVVGEKRCCQFWGFAVDNTDGDLTCAGMPHPQPTSSSPGSRPTSTATNRSPRSAASSEREPVWEATE